ncbi:hypothetical protein AAHA92_30265 [Salvia divinorum]|uniref:Glycine-rich protein n=1 Tax=Salvia divinorum TaxID=28513 RepID=A0ABD1G465_SALDI
MASKMVLVFVVMSALIFTSSTARMLGGSAINDEKDVIIIRDPDVGGGFGEGIGEEGGYRYEGGDTGIVGGEIP